MSIDTKGFPNGIELIGWFYNDDPADPRPLTHVYRIDDGAKTLYLTLDFIPDGSTRSSLTVDAEHTRIADLLEEFEIPVRLRAQDRDLFLDALSGHTHATRTIPDPSA